MFGKFMSAGTGSCSQRSQVSLLPKSTTAVPCAALFAVWEAPRQIHENANVNYRIPQAITVCYIVYMLYCTERNLSAKIQMLRWSTKLIDF